MSESAASECGSAPTSADELESSACTRDSRRLSLGVNWFCWLLRPDTVAMADHRPPPSLPDFVRPLSSPHPPGRRADSRLDARARTQKLAEKLGQGAFGSVYKVRSGQTFVERED